MSNSELLTVEPLDLQFPFELKKQISCSLYLTNKTDNNVAFKVKTTNPKKYCVGLTLELFFPGLLVKFLETISKATSLAREWQEAQLTVEKTSKKKNTGKSPLIGFDFTLCHSDAAWDESSKRAGLGWIFTNRSSGLRRSNSSTATHVRSPLLAEALAIRSALSQAADLGFAKLSIASDSKSLIEAINSESPLLELHGILQDILILSLSFQEISFKFISREKNGEADALAKLSLRNSVPFSL